MPRPRSSRSIYGRGSPGPLPSRPDKRLCTTIGRTTRCERPGNPTALTHRSDFPMSDSSRRLRQPTPFHRQPTPTSCPGRCSTLRTFRAMRLGRCGSAGGSWWSGRLNRCGDSSSCRPAGPLRVCRLDGSKLCYTRTDGGHSFRIVAEIRHGMS